jgi:hypothetical protein
MPRPVSIRLSYRDDAGFLLRLEAAVGKDERQTSGWRKQTAQLIRQLAMRLLKADAGMGGETEDKGKSIKKERRSIPPAKAAAV